MRDPSISNCVDYLGYQISVETAERRISSSRRVWSARFQLEHNNEVVQQYAQACDGIKTEAAAIAKALRFAKIAIDVRIDVRAVREQRWRAPTRKTQGPVERTTRDVAAAQPGGCAFDS